MKTTPKLVNDQIKRLVQELHPLVVRELGVTEYGLPKIEPNGNVPYLCYNAPSNTIKFNYQTVGGDLNRAEMRNYVLEELIHQAQHLVNPILDKQVDGLEEMKRGIPADPYARADYRIIWFRMHGNIERVAAFWKNYIARKNSKIPIIPEIDTYEGAIKKVSDSATKLDAACKSLMTQLGRDYLTDAEFEEHIGSINFRLLNDRLKRAYGLSVLKKDEERLSDSQLKDKYKQLLSGLTIDKTDESQENAREFILSTTDKLNSPILNTFVRDEYLPNLEELIIKRRE